MVHSKPFSVQPDRTTGKSERGIRDNVKPVGKPEPLVHENLASTQELAKQALDAVQSSTLSDDSKDAYAALADALGTRNQDFVQGLFGQLLEANARGGQKFDTRELFFMLALIKEKKTKDPLLAMHLAQMGTVHATLMKAAGELAQAETLQHKELMLRAVNQLSRTFTAQLEGVKRYLSAPVRNFSVSVAEGGQAIVGDVTQAVDRAVSAATANVTPAISDAHRVPMEVPRDREPVTMPRVPPAS
jgi:hypothetical protein